jgi:uncharacterized repeat protein (TIGR01451 family)
MHNEVRVNPTGTIPEVGETSNIATIDTPVVNGDATYWAFNELQVSKAQTSPNPGPVAINGTVIYTITASNSGTDPVNNVEVQDFPPVGSRLISAVDGNPGPPGSGAFQCSPLSGGGVDCVGGSLPGTGGPPVPPGTAGTRTIIVTLNAPGTANDPSKFPNGYPNQSIIDPNHQIPEGNETNNTSSIFTQVVGTGGANKYIDLTIIAKQPVQCRRPPWRSTARLCTH